jgi:hypothetical protein
MKLKNLFQALVVSGTALGAAHCGGGMATEPGAAGTGAPGSTTTLPDGGTVPTNPSMPGMPGGGAPGW